jgi:hypothetical protein
MSARAGSNGTAPIMSPAVASNGSLAHSSNGVNAAGDAPMFDPTMPSPSGGIDQP